MSQSQLTPAASENLATSTNGKVSSKTPQLEETTSIQTVEAETPTEEIDEANNLVPAPTPSTPKQKRPLFLAIGAIALGALAIGGWKYWEFASTHVSTENAQILRTSFADRRQDFCQCSASAGERRRLRGRGTGFGGDDGSGFTLETPTGANPCPS